MQSLVVVCNTCNVIDLSDRPSIHSLSAILIRPTGFRLYPAMPTRSACNIALEISNMFLANTNYIYITSYAEVFLYYYAPGQRIDGGSGVVPDEG